MDCHNCAGILLSLEQLLITPSLVKIVKQEKKKVLGQQSVIANAG